MADGRRVADYDYVLPPELVARYPAARRDESRLMVLGARSSSERHLRFSDLPELVEEGDAIVLNESRVLPARLLGYKPSGAAAEVLLVRPGADGSDPSLWEALVRPGGKLKPGRVVRVAHDLTVRVLDGLPGGGRLVRLEGSDDPMDAVERRGHVPIPPYLGRPDEPLDRIRYQTVFARVPGSVAAPTAGLHFTPELLERVRAAGAVVTRLVLHVGPGTFRPVVVDDARDHAMHEESFEIPEEVVEAIRGARIRGNRVWAVGTTVVRALESAAEDGTPVAGPGRTRLFIRPPYRPVVVDRLITNFHLPRSTLLMLVAALGGYDRVMAAYREAIRERYRFYSYGDAMVVP